MIDPNAKAPCIEHAANETAALREECRAREWAEAEAMALVLSHEGTIERLTAENARLQAELAEAAELLRGVYHGWVSGEREFCPCCAFIAAHGQDVDARRDAGER